MTIKNQSEPNLKHTIKLDSGIRDDICRLEEPDGSTTLVVGKIHAERVLESKLTYILMDSIYEQFMHSMIPVESYYLPAARSGIIQGYKALSASIVRNSAFSGAESFGALKLTGVVSDFISNIIMIPTKRGYYFDLAEQLESEILGGHIRIPNHGENAFPEITYSSSNNTIPLYVASSTISEIAPLSLYLKHIVKPGGLLIIEEPEAHLHPENHLIIAKYIVRMIRQGLNVLVTTHSVFLLEQLAHFVLASKVRHESRRNLGAGDTDDYLLPGEVSPYVFTMNSEDESNILPIEITDEDGIPQDEFVRVTELLYSTYLKLHKHLPDA